MNGYLGSDLSGTGRGLKWDFIIVHESGHEWFGNSITTADIADMWVHEGITQYSEALFTECQQGTAAGQEYVIGLRKKIENKKPIIGPYGVNQEGPGDMYPKGANLMHMIRHIIGDSTFKAMMLEMNKRFYHKVTSSAEVEDFMINFDAHTQGRLNKSIFDQYLRTVRIPVLEWGWMKGRHYARWTNCLPEFHMDIVLGVPYGLEPVGTKWQCLGSLDVPESDLDPDQNWYVNVSHLSAKELKRAVPKGTGRKIE
jgi:hypothetical protein